MSHPHIEVIYQLDSHGKPHPLHFVWEGKLYEIQDIGREWEEDNQMHVLVRASNEQVYELIYDSTLRKWYLKTFPIPPQAA